MTPIFFHFPSSRALLHRMNELCRLISSNDQQFGRLVVILVHWTPGPRIRCSVIESYNFWKSEFHSGRSDSSICSQVLFPGSKSIWENRSSCLLCTCLQQSASAQYRWALRRYHETLKDRSVHSSVMQGILKNHGAQ